MHIKLVSTKVAELNLYTELDKPVEADVFNLSYSDCYADDRPSNFLVRFEVSIHSVNGFKIDVVFFAEFETDEEITDEFRESSFPVINAPAIAYPFLRSFIGTVTLNAGVEPLLLDAVNFQALAKKMNRKSS